MQKAVLGKTGAPQLEQKFVATFVINTDSDFFKSRNAFASIRNAIPIIIVPNMIRVSIAPMNSVWPAVAKSFMFERMASSFSERLTNNAATTKNTAVITKDNSCTTMKISDDTISAIKG